MAKNLQVRIDFTGDSTALVDAVKKLKAELKGLDISTNQVAQASKKQEKATKQVTKATKENSTATNKNSSNKKKNARDGQLATKSNRLLKRSFATLRSEILLASFAFGTIGSLVGKFISLSNTQEDAEKRLSTALGFRSQKLLDSASAMQELTRFGDEEIIQAQALIASFVEEEDAIIRATEATLDLASAKNMDLRAAADLVSKSVGSSTNALTRYGIQVSGAVGSTERLETAVNGISKAFGDTATEDAKTFGGQVDQLGNRLNDFGEDIGDVQKTKLKPLLERLNEGSKSLIGNDKAAKGAASALIILAGAFTMMMSGGIVRVLISSIATLGANLGVVARTAKVAFGTVGKLFTRVFGKKGAKAVKEVSDKVVPFSTKLQTFAKSFLNVASSSIIATQMFKILGTTAEDNAVKLTKQEEAQEKLDQRNNAAFLALKPLVEEQLKQSIILGSSTKMQETNNKALFKTMTQVEKATGQDIILTADKIEQLGLHGAMVEGLTEKEKELFNTRLALNEQSIAGSISDKKAIELRVAALSQLGQTMAGLAPESKSAALLAIRLQQIQAVANAYASFNSFMGMTPPRPGLATLSLAQGLANASMIEKQSSKVQSAALGADFIADSPQLLKVGDNPQMRERVTVTPLGSPNVRGGEGASEININLNGNILGTEEFVRDTLIPEIENTVKRNLA